MPVISFSLIISITLYRGFKFCSVFLLSNLENNGEWLIEYINTESYFLYLIPKKAIPSSKIVGIMPNKIILIKEVCYNTLQFNSNIFKQYHS